MRPAISSRGGQRKLRKWSLKLNLNFIQIERIAKDSYTELWNWRFCCKGRIWGAFHSTKIPVWNFGHSHTQWHGTFCLHRPNPSHCAFGYCSCKQDIKERNWEQQFCRMERDISVRPKWPDQSKWTTFKAGSKNSGRTKSKWTLTFDVTTEISGILGWMERALGEHAVEP